MMQAAWYFPTMIVVMVLSIFLGAGMQSDHDQSKIGDAFGCGRFYAGNFDPAEDPRDERSPCYPYYKAWDARQWKQR